MLTSVIYAPMEGQQKQLWQGIKNLEDTMFHENQPTAMKVTVRPTTCIHIETVVR
jgi:hypothetical protein